MLRMLHTISAQAASAIIELFVFLSQTCSWIFQYRFQPILLRSWLDLGRQQCKLSGIADSAIHSGLFYLDSRISEREWNSVVPISLDPLQMTVGIRRVLWETLSLVKLIRVSHLTNPTSTKRELWSQNFTTSQCVS